jgi:CubicO group peptidase (beta-lactamase class C family)
MPLGMHRTFFDRAPNHLRPHRSHSYVRDGQGFREAPFDFDTGVTVSNGGLNAPMTDMVRYLTFLLGHCPADRTKAHDQVLARASLEEMWRPVIRARDGEGGSGNDVQAALSFFVERHDSVELVGHSGQQAGFLSHIYLHRPSGTAWAVAFNTDVVADAGGTRGLTTRGVDDAVRAAIVRLLTGAP